jgi:uncharacterized protein YdaU (DUF1376 family)
MAEFPALPLWTDALIGDTHHLTPAEFGAYMRLLITAWRSPDCCLPNDDVFLGRAIGDSRNWARLKQSVLPFFSIGSDGYLRQKRLTRERRFVLNKKARSAAGGRAKALKSQEVASAKRLLNGCQTPAPTPTPIGIASKKEANGQVGGKRGKPRHGQQTKDHRRVWFDRGTPEWKQYAADYAEHHGHDVSLNWNGAGSWFYLAGEETHRLSG